MVLGCKTLWTALQILWSTIYVVCGAFQLMAAIFFLISVSELTLYSVLFAGSWNIIIGIAGGMVACIGVVSSKRQETLLYLAVSILAVNAVTVVLTEWKLYFMDMPKLLNSYTNHVLIDYALFVVRIAVTTVIVASFLDSQFAYCSAQSLPKIRTKKRVHGSHDQVSDIEYIIPRSKSTKSAQPHQIYDAYAQSWVFDAENPGCSNGSAGTNNESAYLKILQNGTPKNPLGRPNGLQNGSTVKEVTHLIDNPVVHVEEASDDSTSNSDRKLCHMKSFSRSASPVILSNSSSQLSLNNYNPVPTNPPIYEYLEKLTEPQIYRSRLNTAVSNKSQEEDLPQYQSPQTVMMRRVETVSPQVVEPVQYASLMKELQRAIVSKKEPPSVTSPLSNSESQSHSKSSDTEFSKELEAALQLIQDLESPNTAETPSDPQNPRPLAVWRKNSEPSGSEKTLSAVGSMAEITSPLTETVVPQDHSPTSTGKSARVVVRYPDSQSTSGYSSPSHGPTPNWSTTSSINGSNNDILKPVSYHIHNAKQTTVISLYSQPADNAKGKSVTLVKITGDSDPFEHSKTIEETPIHSSTLNSNSNKPNSFLYTNDLSSRLAPTPVEINNTNTTLNPQPKSTENNPNPAGIWNIKSLLRKKKNSTFPRLCPELEGAIIKSESLAYLSEVELLARAKRNEEIQREIEERVIQQLGVPRSESESNC